MNKEITGHTALYCLLGHPVAHSISPQMHNLAFTTLGIDARYLAFDVPEQETGAAVAAIKTLGIRGCNLTMPLKKSILPYLDELSPASQLCGAVNTVIHRDGRLLGDTTDGVGFLDSLSAAGFSISGKTLCLLGPGGAGSAIAASAALSGAKQIFLCKRKNSGFTDTEAFADSINSRTDCKASAVDIEDDRAMTEAASASDLLINATPIGMEDTGGDPEAMPVSGDILRKGLFVADIIYHPEKTALLREAEKTGCSILNGKYMLLYQGSASFKLWTGQDMPVELVREQYFH